METSISTVLHVLANISLKDRIVRGKYDWVNLDITEEHFPTNVPVDYDAEHKLFHSRRNILSDDAIRKMKEYGFRPAMLTELLVLGETQPELQKQFPIVALGSFWRDSDGERCVPVLDLGDGKRRLDLSWFEDGWYDFYRFLAVRK